MIVHWGETYVRTAYVGDRRVEILKRTVSGKRDDGLRFHQSGYVIKFCGTSDEYFKDENNEEFFGSKQKAMSFTNPPPRKEKV